MSSNWPLVQLGELISIKHGFAFKGEFFSDTPTDTVLVTPGNFAIGGGFKADKLKFYSGPIPTEYELKADDLIVTMTDLSKQADTLGYSALVPEHSNRLYLHNQRIGLVEIKSQELDKLYLYFLMRSREYRHHVVSSATGSTVKHTSPSKITSFEFHLPPLKIQKNIGRSLKHLEDKTAINHQINQTLEQMAQAIFKSWFVDFEPVKAKIAALEASGSEEDALLAAMQAISGKGESEITRLQAEQPEQYAELRATAELFPSAMQDSELGGVPEGWTIAPFSSIARLDTTSVKPAQDPEKVWEHYSIPAFDEGATPAFETGADIKSNKYKVYPTAVLSSKLNPHFPRTWIPDVQNSDAAICSTEFMQFVPRESQHRAFIAGMVTSEPFQSGIMMRVTGSTGSRQRAQPKQVAAMDVILPKSELRAAYSQHTEAMYRTQSKNIWQARSLSSLRDTLLPKLLSGELSVIDAENQLTEEERMPQEEIN